MPDLRARVDLLLALLSGALLALSFPRYGHPAFAWIALVPLLVTLHGGIAGGPGGGTGTCEPSHDLPDSARRGSVIARLQPGRSAVVGVPELVLPFGR